jgi:hypothetical protein
MHQSKFQTGFSNSAELTEVSSQEMSNDQFLFRTQKSLLDQVSESITSNLITVPKIELEKFAN